MEDLAVLMEQFLSGFKTKNKGVGKGNKDQYVRTYDKKVRR